MKYGFPIALLLFIFTACGEDKSVKVDPGTEDLDSLISLYPDSVPLLIKRGEESVLEADYESAIADAAKAFRIDSSNLDARRLYAEVLTNKMDKTVADIAAAQKHYEVVVNKRPKDLKALVGLASTYRLQQDYDNTFKYVNKALRIDPRYRDAYVLKGSTYLLLGDSKLAKSSYETAVQQDPEFFEAYIMLGSIYQAENNPICIQYYTTARDLKPSDMDAIYALAYAKQLFGDINEAFAMYREMAQDTTEYYVSRGLFHQAFIHQFGEDESIDSAIYYYNSALQTNPMYVESWYNLGLCYADKKEQTLALTSYAKALKYARQQNYTEEFIEKVQKDADKMK